MVEYILVISIAIMNRTFRIKRISVAVESELFYNEGFVYFSTNLGMFLNVASGFFKCGIGYGGFGGAVIPIPGFGPNMDGGVVDVRQVVDYFELLGVVE